MRDDSTMRVAESSVGSRAVCSTIYDARGQPGTCKRSHRPEEERAKESRGKATAMAAVAVEAGGGTDGVAGDSGRVLSTVQAVEGERKRFPSEKKGGLALELWNAGSLSLLVRCSPATSHLYLHHGLVYHYTTHSHYPLPQLPARTSSLCDLDQKSLRRPRIAATSPSRPQIGCADAVWEEAEKHGTGGKRAR
jgi:hypothetical protein